MYVYKGHKFYKARKIYENDFKVEKYIYIYIDFNLKVCMPIRTKSQREIYIHKCIHTKIENLGANSIHLEN
jgi:hypothetical protein